MYHHIINVLPDKMTKEADYIYHFIFIPDLSSGSFEVVVLRAVEVFGDDR